MEESDVDDDKLVDDAEEEESCQLASSSGVVQMCVESHHPDIGACHGQILNHTG